MSIKKYLIALTFEIYLIKIQQSPTYFKSLKEIRKMTSWVNILDVMHQTGVASYMNQP
jgi:hypothetical protein